MAMEMEPYLSSIIVEILIEILHCTVARCYHGSNWMKYWYKLYFFFTALGESIIISRRFVKNMYYPIKKKGLWSIAQNARCRVSYTVIEVGIAFQDSFLGLLGQTTNHLDVAALICWLSSQPYHLHISVQDKEVLCHTVSSLLQGFN